MIVPPLQLVAALVFQLAPALLAAVRVTTFAGTGNRGSADGLRLSSSFNGLTDITFDPFGNLYVADTGNHRIRKISTSGIISTLTANGRYESTEFDDPDTWLGYIESITSDSAGNVLAVDRINDVVRKITPDGTVSVVGGNSATNSNNEIPFSAQFDLPNSVTVDANDRIYVTDMGNHRIQKITASGDVSTFAGDGTQGFKNGPGPLARFSFPFDITADLAGNIYVTEDSHSCIRKISPNGTVSTFVGDEIRGYVYNSTLMSRYSRPLGVTTDTNGNVYVSDSYAHRIRKITPDGNISTVAGLGAQGFVDGSAQEAMFSHPTGIAADINGNLFVVDSGNQCIRKITFVDGDDDEEDGSHGFHGTVTPKPISYNVDECAICYETKGVGDDYDYCSMSCGNTFHRRCIDRCMIHTVHRRCPMCRSRWIMNKPSVAIPSATSDAE